MSHLTRSAFDTILNVQAQQLAAQFAPLMGLLDRRDRTALQPPVPLIPPATGPGTGPDICDPPAALYEVRYVRVVRE